MDLVSKDLYIQSLASRVFSQRPQLEPKKRRFGNLKGAAKDNAATKKNKVKKKTLKSQQNKTTTNPVTQKTEDKASPDEVKVKAKKGNANLKKNNVEIKFSGVDLLRKRLHEKIEESRGQGPPKDASSPEVQAKRAKRKLERERKKRKRKEIQMKKLSEKSEVETRPEIKQEGEIVTPISKRNETGIVFNKVETVEEGYEDKMLKKQNKRKSLKGQITPLTGKNYKQLLSRVEARKTKLEQLKEKDADKALEMENKMKWTNLLYKAEGIKIKDDEKMLRVALKRKEKRKTQRKKKWDQRSENVLEKMQHRQDKRKKNILKRKKVKVEKKKDRARKRGRVLPEDLKKAGI
ncbi:hypothetical protein NL108_002186 [Boleophthalmus pectinirostris]|uniref:surfeit locus protein 6 n=1 Tax=Boleophthalmus pectinirostris TaxID=150288 RepID=UPI000A1C3B8F|nr:surfeit locus protein 6 [Boleophthalmus pectinirostris]KAJ0057253.1 hypothetical protein NL108_002186 [Boleophthalmus pectinirostris]